MPNVKNLNNLDEPRAHRFFSSFAEHVGEDKLDGSGRNSRFRHDKVTRPDTGPSDLMLAAQNRHKEQAQRPAATGFMRKKGAQDKYAPKDYK